MRERMPSSVTTATLPVMVRLRCVPCEVAWSGPAESACWVCGDAGTPINTGLVASRGGFLSFDTELVV